MNCNTQKKAIAVEAMSLEIKKTSTNSIDQIKRVVKLHFAKSHKKYLYFRTFF